MTSICDERGQELLYAGVPITDVFKEDLGIGGVLGLLWFQRKLVVTMRSAFNFQKPASIQYRFDFARALTF